MLSELTMLKKPQVQLNRRIRFSYKLAAVIVGCIVALWVFFMLWGQGIIHSMYEGKSILWLNNIIEGQSQHDVNYYYQLAQRAVELFSWWGGLGGLFFIFAGILKNALPIFCRRHPGIAAGFLGMALCVFLIGTTEAVLGMLHLGEKITRHHYPPSYGTYDSVGIKKAVPGRHRVVLENKKTGKVIYDVEYTIDQFGRRSIPVGDQSMRDQFLLFMGDSFTFGEGLSDDETLPYYIAAQTPRYAVYNYGFHGLGPFDILAKLQHTPFQQEISQANGRMIYVFIDDHIHRLMGAMSLMSWKFKDVYYRITPEGRLIRQGSFQTGRPFLTKMYRFLNQSRILKALGIDFPVRISRKHIQLTAQALRVIYQRFRTIYPGGEFYVLIFPRSRYGDALMQDLKESGIWFLNYTHLFSMEDAQFFISPEERHPSALAYQLIAKQVVQDLHLR